MPVQSSPEDYLLSQWQQRVSAWKTTRKPLHRVRASTYQHPVGAMAVELWSDGRLRIERADGVVRERPRRAARELDAAFAAAQDLAAAPPPRPATRGPAPGTPGRSLVLQRGHAIVLTIPLTAGTYDPAPEYVRAEQLHGLLLALLERYG